MLVLALNLSLMSCKLSRPEFHSLEQFGKLQTAGHKPAICFPKAPELRMVEGKIFVVTLTIL